MNTLDQWEAEAKKDQGKKYAGLSYGEMELYGDQRNDRIIALIDLVRKKDSALKSAYGFVKAEELKGRNKLTVLQVEEALALTEELK